MSLTDIEELVDKVRDPSSRQYYVEAVRSYHAQAYRSAIVSLWIAVVYDIFSKIRELASGGDGAAKKFVKEWNQAREHGDVRAQQQIEQAILETASDNFHLVSDQERSDLHRLMEDRHRCAHPAYADAHLLFAPSPELVRAHLVHAVTHLLGSPPVQGKAALKQALTDLTRDSFPSSEEHAITYVTEKYLRRSRRSLRRNFVVALLKALIQKNVAALKGKERNAVHALMAARRSHPDEFEVVITKELNRIVDGLDDEQLGNIGRLIAAEPRAWRWLSEPNRLRVAESVRNVDAPLPLEVVDGYVRIPELRDGLMEAVKGMDEDDQMEFIRGCPHEVFELLAANLYKEKSLSFRGAEATARAIIEPLLPSLSAEGVKAILEAVIENGQVRMAGDTPPLIERMFDQTRHLLPATKESWKWFVEQVLDDQEPEDYYAYPDIRRRVEDEGIEVQYPEVVGDS